MVHKPAEPPAPHDAPALHSTEPPPTAPEEDAHPRAPAHRADHDAGAHASKESSGNAAPGSDDHAGPTRAGTHDAPHH